MSTVKKACNNYGEIFKLFFIIAFSSFIKVVVYEKLCKLISKCTYTSLIILHNYLTIMAIMSQKCLKNVFTFYTNNT